MEVRVELAHIRISELGGEQVIVLRERNGHRYLPIMIGLAEVWAIDRRLKGQKLARPFTHELLADVITTLGGELEKIVITELRDRTFFAKLVIRRGGDLFEVDSRPSDAIALAAGSDVAIYVAEQVLRDAGQAPT